MEIKGRFDHFNINVTDLERSLAFYDKALGLKEIGRKEAADGSYRLVFLGDGVSPFHLELTWLRDHAATPYELGENESHLCLRVAGDYDAVREYHRALGCVCFENHTMGLYFINDPDDYWIEILPMKQRPQNPTTMQQKKPFERKFPARFRHAEASGRPGAPGDPKTSRNPQGPQGPQSPRTPKEAREEAALQEEVERTVEVLRRGGIILYPTDTVWGLGCDATNAEAVERIYRLKRSENKKSMLVLCGSADMVVRYVNKAPAIAFEVMELATSPLTAILPGAAGLAPNLIPDEGTLGVRIPDHAFCRRMLRAFGKPVVSTSANLSGEATPAGLKEVTQEIVDGVDFVVNPRFEGHPTRKASSIIAFGEGGEVKVIRN